MKIGCITVVVMLNACSTWELLNHERHLMVKVGIPVCLVYGSISNSFENVNTSPTVLITKTKKVSDFIFFLKSNLFLKKKKKVIN